MEFHYQSEILAQLLTHGVRPLPRTRPAIIFRYLNGLYRYELRRLKRLREEGAIPQREYGARVVALRRRYPLVSVPVTYWTLPGTPADPEDVPLC
jgi:transposase InsO family protein